MKPKNIYFVIHEYSGANTYARQLYSYLHNLDYIKFHFIYLGTSRYKQFTVAEKEGMFVFYIPCTGQTNTALYSRRVTELLSPWIKGKENVIVHLNNPNQHYLGQYFKTSFNAKIVYTLHFLMSYFTAGKTGNTPLEKDKTGNKEVIGTADKVIGVTQFASHWIEKYYRKSPDCIETIPNGYSGTDCLLAAKDKKELKTELGFREDDLLLLYVGRLDMTKGCDKLLAAMNQIHKTFPRLHLILAGDGNYKSSLNMVGLNCAKIHFTGYLPENKLTKLYQIADIGIIPSLWEQCSYVALEMMAHQLPVIYSGVPGLNELFEDKVTGRSIPYYCDDSPYGINIKTEDLAEAITELANDDTYRNNLGLRAWQKWKIAYTSENMGQRTLTLYNTLYE